MTQSRKTIFDMVRRLMNRGFRQSEVAELDAVIDDAVDRALVEAAAKANGRWAEISSQEGVPCVPSVPHVRRTEGVEPHETHRIGAAGVALIKRFEGCARLRRDGLIEA